MIINVDTVYDSDNLQWAIKQAKHQYRTKIESYYASSARDRWGRACKISQIIKGNIAASCPAKRAYQTSEMPSMLNYKASNTGPCMRTPAVPDDCVISLSRNRLTFARPRGQVEYQDTFSKHALTSWQVSSLTQYITGAELPAIQTSIPGGVRGRPKKLSKTQATEAIDWSLCGIIAVALQAVPLGPWNNGTLNSFYPPSHKTAKQNWSYLRWHVNTPHTHTHYICLHTHNMWIRAYWRPSWRM